MKIGFFMFYRKDPIHYVLAEVMIASARRHMPDVEIVMLTDDRSPPTAGANRVLRKQSGQMALLRAEHQADLSGDWLFVDTDVVFNKSVEHVFDDPDFDIAVADREGQNVGSFADDMPHNAGVVFCRQPAFFQTVIGIMKAMPLDKVSWLGDQLALNFAVKSGAFKVKVLPGLEYNYPPNSHDDPLAKTAAIVHYKGNRKPFMIPLLGPALSGHQSSPTVEISQPR